MLYHVYISSLITIIGAKVTNKNEEDKSFNNRFLLQITFFISHKAISSTFFPYFAPTNCKRIGINN